MAKSIKTVLYFAKNDDQTFSKIYNLQQEFPEIKIIAIEDDPELAFVYYYIKFPVKIRENIELYLHQYGINYE